MFDDAAKEFEERVLLRKLVDEITEYFENDEKEDYETKIEQFGQDYKNGDISLYEMFDLMSELGNTHIWGKIDRLNKLLDYSEFLKIC